MMTIQVRHTGNSYWLVNGVQVIADSFTAAVQEYARLYQS